MAWPWLLLLPQLARTDERSQPQCIHMENYPGNCPVNIMKGACWSVFVFEKPRTRGRLMGFFMAKTAVLWHLRAKTRSFRVIRGSEEGVNWACMPDGISSGVNCASMQLPSQAWKQTV